MLVIFLLFILFMFLWIIFFLQVLNFTCFLDIVFYLSELTLTVLFQILDKLVENIEESEEFDFKILEDNVSMN